MSTCSAVSKLGLALVVFASLTPISTFAGGVDHVLAISSSSGATGEVVPLSITHSSTDLEPMLGWSFGVVHDATELRLVDVSMGAHLSPLTPEFAETIIWAFGWTTVTVLSYDGSMSMPPALDRELYVAEYEILGSCGLPPATLSFTDTLGFPPVATSVLLPSGSTTPTTGAGEVAIDDFGTNFYYTAEQQSIRRGEVRPVLYSINDNDPGGPRNTQGFSMAADHDPALVDAIAVDAYGPLTMVGSGTRPDFFSTALFPNGWTVGVVYSFPGSVLQYPEETAVISVSYTTNSTASGAVSPLRFTDTLGSPPVENLIVVDGASYAPCGVPGSLTIADPSTPFIRGDTNGDGVIDLGDAITLLARLFSSGTVGTCANADDVNADAAIDIADAIALLDYAFSGGARPPAPSPDCGTAPEVLGCEETTCR